MPRLDTLTSVHKAIRAMVYERGGALQTTDFADRQEATTAAADLEAVLLHDHHTTEEKFVFPKLRPLEEQLVDAMLAQHKRSSDCWTSPRWLGCGSRRWTRRTAWRRAPL